MRTRLFLLTVFGLAFLSLIIPRAISAQNFDCQAQYPDKPQIVCAASSPGSGCISVGQCTGGVLDQYCCPAPAQNGSNNTNSGGSASNEKVLCGDGKSINTAIGCVPALSNSAELMNFILGWAIGVGGGVAFLLILFAGFQIMTSSGDPQRLKAGQELLTAAISGLIMLIFSVFILRVIGVNILGI